MRKKFVFATNNSHKLEEVTAILGEKVELLSMKDIKCDTDIPETADTLEGNALLKARYIFDNYHLDCFADDTGLEVEALGGAPGVYSARYAGDAHNSEANMKKLLKDMEGIENRKAQFRTVFVLIIDGKEHLFEGIVKGEITKNRKGASGFGYDPIFIPEGYTQTFAEMGNELKNKISHRALATNKLCKFLREFGISFVQKSVSWFDFSTCTGSASGLFSKKEYAVSAAQMFMMKLCMERCLECTMFALFLSRSLIHSMMYLLRSMILSHMDMSLFFMLALNPCTRCMPLSKRSSKSVCLMYPLSAKTFP